MNVQNWLRMATSKLINSESPRRDAEILLGFVTGRTRTQILAFGEVELVDTLIQLLVTLLSRRKKGEPIAYITGIREFWSLPLFVSPVTVIPRPDTECLVELALALLSPGICHILDLGTGTGAIALALASERPDCQITAIDTIPGAIQLAKNNTRNLGIQNVQVILSNWFNGLAKRSFDLIVSNPPYIDKKDPYLSLGDVRFEPHTALVSADKGLADIRRIVATSRLYLRAIGWLLIEHGWTLGTIARMLFTEAGFHSVKTYCDYGGNERLTLGRWG